MAKQKRIRLKPAKELARLFRLDGRAGVLRTPQGQPCGWKSGKGYLYVRVDGRAVMVHRIIFKMVHNTEPRYVDHIDRNKTNNRPSNLRAATHGQNGANSVIRWTGRQKGVSKNHDRWMARVRKGKVVHYLGTFDTEEEAHQAYVVAARRLHGRFFHDGS